MKSLRIFFGIACLVVAIGSAVASKALTSPAPDYVYYYDASEEDYVCVQRDITQCNTTVTTPCQFTVSGILYTYYNEFDLVNFPSTKGCKQPLYLIP